MFDLVMVMLAENPHNRPSMDDVCKTIHCPWVRCELGHCVPPAIDIYAATLIFLCLATVALPPIDIYAATLIFAWALRPSRRLTSTLPR